MTEIWSRAKKGPDGDEPILLFFVRGIGPKQLPSSADNNDTNYNYDYLHSPPTNALERLLYSGINSASEIHIVSLGGFIHLLLNALLGLRRRSDGTTFHCILGKCAHKLNVLGL